MSKEIPTHLQYDLDLVLACEKLLEHALPRLAGDSWERRARRIHADLRENRRALVPAIQRYLRARDNRYTNNTDAILIAMMLCPPTLVFTIPCLLWEGYTGHRCEQADATLTVLLMTTAELHQATAAIMSHLEDLGDTEWQAIWQEFAPSHPSAARSPQTA